MLTVKFAVAQGFGIVAVLMFILSFQIRSNRALYITQAIGCGCFCVQFFLLDAFSGCFNMLLAILRNLALSRIKEWKWLQWKGWIVILTEVQQVN